MGNKKGTKLKSFRRLLSSYPWGNLMIEEKIAFINDIDDKSFINGECNWIKSYIILGAINVVLIMW